MSPYRESAKPLMERLVPKRRVVVSRRIPKDLEARSDCWGLKIRAISGGNIGFGVDLGHDRLNWLHFLVRFLFWTLSVIVVKPGYARRSGSCMYGDITNRPDENKTTK